MAGDSLPVTLALDECQQIDSQLGRTSRTYHRLGHVRRATQKVCNGVLQGLGVGGAEDGAVEEDCELYAWVLANCGLWIIVSLALLSILAA